jgi:AcrR family transcriptional regulator
MARPKEFDRDVAVARAMSVFWSNGYAATSTDDLLQAMKIGRQSMYDTFGDKRQLYLEALRLYNTESVTETIRTMSASSSPRKGIETALLSFANHSVKEAALGCLGVSAVCEFGRSDRAVNAESDASVKRLVAAFERRLTDAQALGDISADVDVAVAAQFLASTLTGIKVSARGGASAETLRATVHFAMRSLR